MLVATKTAFNTQTTKARMGNCSKEEPLQTSRVTRVTKIRSFSPESFQIKESIFKTVKIKAENLGNHQMLTKSLVFEHNTGR